MEENYDSHLEDIEKFIEFINDLTTEIYYEHLMCNGKTLFQCGACYEFVKIIKEFFDIDNILIANDFCHCAFEYRGNYYDSLGIIKDKENFSIVTDDEMIYMEDRFGIHLKRYKIFETIIDEISRIEKVPYLPINFYENRERSKFKVKTNAYY
ncbi:MAG: hypothetical protein E7157_05045 [Lactobacillales bacterium]|nr:hypothetical protein [Lactobacillales bacterium]